MEGEVTATEVRVETVEAEGDVVTVEEAFTFSVDDSRVERPSVSSPFGDRLLD